MASFTPHMTIEKWFFLLITGVVMWLFWQIIEPFAMVILIAAVVTIILVPVDRLLRKWLKSPRLSAAILSLGVFVLLFLPLLVLLVIMAGQASDLVASTLNDGSWMDQLNPETSTLFATLPPIIQEELLSVDLSELSKTIASWAFENIGSLFSSTTKLLINTVLFFISMFYLIVEREKLYKEALALSPLRDSIDTKILKRISNTIRSVVFGVLILAVIQGVLAGIGMTIFGVPGSLIWGAVTIIAALVPFVGTALVLGPAVLYLFIAGSTGAAIGLLIWAVIFVALADNFIGPYLIRGTTHMHAFLVLLSVLGGLTAFGSVGIIAGPTILAALLALIELYKSGILTTGKLQK